MLGIETIEKYRQTNRVLFRGSNALYLLPDSGLRKWISNYTILFPQVEAMSEQYSIIPHGCATLVYSCDSREIRSSLFGPMTRVSCVGHEANAASLLFIVEFQPAGYYAFSKLPQNELTNLLIPFEHLDLSLNEDIAYILDEADDLNDFIDTIDMLFLTHVIIDAYPHEFLHANELILRNNGTISVKELSQNVYFSERHLSRVFNKFIGTSTKAFLRLVRVNKAFCYLRQPDTSILRTGMESGYYDNTHFIRK